MREEGAYYFSHFSSYFDFIKVTLLRFISYIIIRRNILKIHAQKILNSLPLPTQKTQLTRTLALKYYKQNYIKNTYCKLQILSLREWGGGARGKNVIFMYRFAF